MAATPSRSFSRRPRAARGAVVILVLVTILFAAFMLARFIQRAGTELLADARAGDRVRLRREAYSALEVTLAVLADFRVQDHGLFSSAQGWERPLEYAGYRPAGGRRVEVSFADESGKVSLPRADAATLEAAFAAFDLDRPQAERASDALLAWMHEDYVAPTLEADPANYERAAIPHHAARRPLRSYDELASVAVVRDVFYDEDGRPNARWHAFANNISLYAFDRTNLNAAQPAALLAGGMGASQVGALGEHFRSMGAGQKNYFTAISEAAGVLGADAPLDRFGTEIQALRINITVVDGAASYRLTAVVGSPGGASPPARAPDADTAAAKEKEQVATTPLKKLDYPFKVLEIREDVESGPVASDPSPAHG